MTRPVTPEAAQRMGCGPVPGRWRVDGNGREIVADFDGEAVRIALLAGNSPGTERANGILLAAAPALAETVASEPERIAAARNALRVEVAAALAAFVESDHAVNRALAAGEIRDEYHPTLFARLARLDVLRGLLTPETTT